MKSIPVVLPAVFATRYRTALAVWAALAAANLAAGVAIASWPDRQSDLHLMRSWATDWLILGSDLYATPGAPDYPPHAIVVLSPLAAVPADWIVALWAGLNLGFALLMPYLAVRAVRPAVTVAECALPALMLLTWGGFRTLLQFTLFALTFGLLSIVLSGNPLRSGLCLALALTKPQVGVPFLLWALFTRRWWHAVVALGTVAIGAAAYCLRSQAAPLDVVTRYAATLWTVYTGDTVLIGLAQLRSLLVLLSADFRLVETASVALALVLLAIVIVAGFRESGPESRVLYSAPALASIWSLLTFYHLTYGFVLLVPAAVRLMLDENPRSQDLRRRLFWLMQVGLMVDIPGAWRRFAPRLSAPAWIDGALSRVDVMLMAVLFLGVLRLALLKRVARRRRGS